MDWKRPGRQRAHYEKLPYSSGPALKSDLLTKLVDKAKAYPVTSSIAGAFLAYAPIGAMTGYYPQKGEVIHVVSAEEIDEASIKARVEVDQYGGTMFARGRIESDVYKRERSCSGSGEDEICTTTTTQVRVPMQLRALSFVYTDSLAAPTVGHSKERTTLSQNSATSLVDCPSMGIRVTAILDVRYKVRDEGSLFGTVWHDTKLVARAESDGRCASDKGWRLSPTSTGVSGGLRDGMSL